MNRIFVQLLLLSIFLGGCAAPAFKLDPNLRPRPWGPLEQAARLAVPCTTPARNFGLNANFRYGCFCGKGHPDLKRGENEELYDFIGRFYSIKAFDSIDLACQDHDVCWILWGDNDGYCNEELTFRLVDFWLHMFERRSESALRCARLASQVGVVFVTLFTPSRMDNSSDGVSSSIQRAIQTMIQTPIFALTLLESDRYPREGDRCEAPMPQIDK